MTLLTVADTSIADDSGAGGFEGNLLSPAESERARTAILEEGSAELSDTVEPPWGWTPRSSTRKVVEGSSGQMIIHVADEVDADVIVVGSHGHGFLSRVLIGSVSEYVVRHTTRPVLVVRHEDEGDRTAERPGRSHAAAPTAPGGLTTARDDLVGHRAPRGRDRPARTRLRTHHLGDGRAPFPAPSAAGHSYFDLVEPGTDGAHGSRPAVGDAVRVAPPAGQRDRDRATATAVRIDGRHRSCGSVGELQTYPAAEPLQLVMTGIDPRFTLAVTQQRRFARAVAARRSGLLERQRPAPDRAPPPLRLALVTSRQQRGRGRRASPSSGAPGRASGSLASTPGPRGRRPRRRS